MSAGVGLTQAQTVGDPAAGAIEAITKPSGDVTMSFTRVGQIARINVKEGDTVQPGQVLIQQDTTAEEWQMSQLKDEADCGIKVDAAVADRDHKQVIYERTKQARASSGAATDLEVKQAMLDVKIAELSLDLSKFNLEQSKKKYEETKAQLDRMQLKSPWVGRVEKLFFQERETPEESAKVIRVVKIDPMWADVPVPTCTAYTKLRVGQSVTVHFCDGDKISNMDGKIKWIGSVADAASDTLLVRVEVPNPQMRPAGEHVTVTFGPSVIAAAKPVSTQPAVSPVVPAKTTPTTAPAAANMMAKDAGKAK